MSTKLFQTIINSDNTILENEDKWFFDIDPDEAEVKPKRDIFFYNYGFLLFSVIFPNTRTIIWEDIERIFRLDKVYSKELARCINNIRELSENNVFIIVRDVIDGIKLFQIIYGEIQLQELPINISNPEVDPCKYVHSQERMGMGISNNFKSALEDLFEKMIKMEMPNNADQYN